jgi:CRISPR system Cascade subunit CasD
MNGVLLIPCVGPMQSWGTRSRFQERDTEREPSKSGVIGMLCAALGRDRSAPVDDLANLKMGVRVDREGKLSKDFQTAQDIAVASGGATQDMVSNRYYLSDAAFLVALEGAMPLLKTIHTALKSPQWPLYLGRKSYVPSEPPYLPDGLERMSHHEALRRWPLMMTTNQLRRHIKAADAGQSGKIRLVFETSDRTNEVRNDQPVSFALGRRDYRQRYVVTEYADIAEFTVGKEVADVSDTVVS